MEEWDSYCSISKKARQILADLDQPSMPNPIPQESKKETWTESLKQDIKSYCSQLQKAHDHTSHLCNLIEKLNERKEGIMTASKEINEKCQQIIQERNYLVALNSAVQSKHFYYVHLENLTAQVLMLARDSVGLRKRFLEIFAQIEDAIQFFTENSNYREASFYLYEYEDLMDSWTSGFINGLSESFQLFYAYYENYFKVLNNSEDLGKTFKQLLLSPGKFEDTMHFMTNIVQQFYKIRGKYAEKVITDALEKIRTEKFVVKQCEMACEVLDRFWNKEKKLFIYYFSEDCPEEGLKVFFLNYSEPVYESLRENLLQETSVQILCETSSLLQSYSKQGSAQIFGSLNQDVQERIIYAATFYLCEEIVASFSDSLIHPAVKSTLKLIKLLSTSVNSQILDNIVSEAISVCINCLKKSIKTEDFNEVHIFLIRNLLNLRENIDNMGIVLRGNSYKELDFSDTKRLFWKLVMGEVSLKKKGVFAELVSSGVPKFNEKSENPLEKELGSACQSYILRTFHEICNPILLIILKSKETGNIPYETVEKTLVESTNRINSIFPQFSQSLFVTLDEKNYKEMTENVSVQILKAFNQLISFMSQNFSDKPIPNISDIEYLLDSSILSSKS